MSGRILWRETPERRSISRTLSAGTDAHCDIAWRVMPSAPPSFSPPPKALIAARKASFGVSMPPKLRQA